MTLVRRLVTALRKEDGMAMVAVMGTLAVMLLLIVVAAQDSGLAGEAANDDRRTTRALQAADAGIEAAAYRLNTLDATNESLKCVTPVAGSGALQLAGFDASVPGAEWCPEVREQLADGTGYAYRVSGEALSQDDSGVVNVTRTVVSTGIDGGETRRVAVELSAITGAPLFGQYGVISLEELRLDSNARIDANARSNEDIVMDSNAVICGNATPGPGHEVDTSSNAKVCNGFSSDPAPTPAVLSPVNADVAFSNDNARICASTSGGVDQSGDPCTDRNMINWDPTRRRLEVQSNATVTLGGSVYSFCHLGLSSNAKLIIAPKDVGSSVRIYIDAPENCGTQSLRGSVRLDSNATISNQNSSPTTLQLYVTGSPSYSTSVELRSNASGDLPMVIYAPYSTVSFESNARLKGAIAAREVILKSNAKVVYHDDVANLQTESGVFPLLRQQQYRECTPAGGSVPEFDADC